MRFSQDHLLLAHGMLWTQYTLNLLAMIWTSWILFYYYFLKFIFGVGSLLLRVGFLFSCGERGLLFIAVCGLLIAVASLVAEHGL